MLDLPSTDPGRYSVEILVMKEMGGWSWHDLCAAPPDLVEEIYHKAVTRDRMREEKRKKDEIAQRAKGNGAKWQKR